MTNVSVSLFPVTVATTARPDDSGNESCHSAPPATAPAPDQRAGRGGGGGRQTAVPADHQARDTVLRVAERHAGPSVVGPVPTVLRRVLRRLLDIVPDRVAAEVAGGRRRMKYRPQMPRPRPRIITSPVHSHA